MDVLVVLAVALAATAAVRSTWSPCGQSMLSTITPLAERTRRHRFGVTATWFVVGAAVGGATLGLGTATVAALLGASVHLTSSTALAIAAVLAALAAASDLRVFGFQLPYHCRQVNELWLNRYRPWVYGAGFGWQVGVGIATFIMTAGVYLMIALAVLTTSPAAALGIGIVFGIVRGLAVVPARRITTPEALGDFHRRFDAAAPLTRRLMITVELAVAAIAAFAAWVFTLTGLGALAIAIAIMIAVAIATVRRRQPRSGDPGAPIVPSVQ
jgi:MFS family permease